MTYSNLPENYFAQNDDEAEARFQEYRQKDPFPRIAPALLNSADIFDYVAKTGIIYPFYPDKLKSAAYRVSIRGKLIYWDEKDEQQKFNIRKCKREEEEEINQENDKKKFTLKRNSIAFVTLEPKFRLPDYIALRFNLKIQHIYRGLLLGTGPLVDPGFTGRLSIPLHNLTNNDYVFPAGEELIEMEFTKLSPNKRWRKSMVGNNSRQGNYKEFRNNPERDVEYYLGKAAPHRSVRSSIPEVFKNAEQASLDATNASKNATDTVKSFQKWITIGAGFSAVVLLISLWTVYYQVYALVEDSVYYVNTAQKDINLVQSELNLMNQLQSELQDLKQEMQDLKRENKEIKDKLSK